MPPPDGQTPQTSAPTDTVEVTSLGTAAVNIEPAEATPDLRDVPAQLRLIQSALNEERVLRLRQVAQTARQVAGIERELEEVTEARSKDGAFWRNLVMHVLVPLAVTAMIVAAAAFIGKHIDWSAGWRPAQDVSATLPVAVPRAAEEIFQPVIETPVDLPPEAPLAAASAETRQMGRLNDALRSVPADTMPQVLNAMNQWLSTNQGTPCWVQSPSGGVALVISSHGAGHPLLDALTRCAEAVEHVTHQ